MTDEQKTPEMLPCPFCGGSPLEVSCMGKTRIECSRMDEGCGVETAFYSKREEAIAAWNKRG